MTSDPAIAPDGRCVVCGNERKLKGLKPLYREQAERDPFCSAACARHWHGVAQ